MNLSSNMITVHLEIKGKVQGVFFRATSKKFADKYGVSGWIKNTDDGNVEAIVSGEKEKIEMFIEWCKQGPANAEVIEVNILHLEQVFFKDFTIKR